MFGLRNNSGSCWVNATLQALYRIPQVQQRYDALETDATNPVDMSMSKIWATHGEAGLSEFYDSVRTTDLPAGQGIGDSEELFLRVCDKMPWLDKLFRFGFGIRIACKHCNFSKIMKDTVLEFPLMPNDSCRTLSDSIQHSVQLYSDDDWKCDEGCHKKGCTQQYLLDQLPEVLVFHRKNFKQSLQYPSLLVLNKEKFALFAVVCHNGGHWWTIGRDLPPGKAWHTFDDTNVQKHSPDSFPVASSMRMLFYART